MSDLRDLICLSHLRWGFVFQRPNHLMSRAARHRRVFFVEEPIFDERPGSQRLDVQRVDHSLFVCAPHLPPHSSPAEIELSQRTLLADLVREQRVMPEVLWFYTPMALPLAEGLEAPVTVYDCMDELTGFRGAPPELVEREAALLRRADLVFTGGTSLYRAKRDRHPHVHAFPSSVEAAHFEQARAGDCDPPDQAPISHPRIGFFGVIDERLDLELIAKVADARPEWQLVMLGPVVKIDPTALPRRPNVHWLGQKQYQELPAYLSGWDVALMPFALNEATRFISPTKTLEYLAAGTPVVSTAIADVVDPYGSAGAVHIADRSEFVAAIERALDEDRDKFRAVADSWVKRTSWDHTWQSMDQLIRAALVAKQTRTERAPQACSTI